MRIVDIFKRALVRWSSDGEFALPNGKTLSPQDVKKFPDFGSGFIASLVAGATYGQSGNVVTVTATGHGLPTTKNGQRIFWPGSAAVPAGWYANYQYVAADTFTFINPVSQTVPPGTLLTATLPYTLLTTFCSYTIPGGTIGATGELSVVFTRSGDTTSGPKNLRLLLGGVWMGLSALTTVPFARHRLTVAAGGSQSYQVGQNAPESGSGGQQYVATHDMTADVVVSLSGSVTNAGQWVGVDNAFVVITK